MLGLCTDVALAAQRRGAALKPEMFVSNDELGAKERELAARLMQWVSSDLEQAIVAVRFVDGRGRPTERYPANPSGSPQGITGLTTADGRFTIVMPHPERVFRSVQMSWAPDGAPEDSPWMRMFRNARRRIG